MRVALAALDQLTRGVFVDRAATELLSRGDPERSGRTRRIARPCSAASSALKTWLNARGGRLRGAALFVGRRGPRLTRRAIDLVVRKIAGAGGLGGLVFGNLRHGLHLPREAWQSAWSALVRLLPLDLGGQGGVRCRCGRGPRGRPRRSGRRARARPGVSLPRRSPADGIAGRTSTRGSTTRCLRGGRSPAARRARWSRNPGPCRSLSLQRTRPWAPRTGRAGQGLTPPQGRRPALAGGGLMLGGRAHRLAGSLGFACLTGPVAWMPLGCLVVVGWA